MLKANNIFKSYGSLKVLKGVDIEVKKGEIVSIVGASGAGKTTLLQILGTLDKPDVPIKSSQTEQRVSIIIDNTDINSLTEKKIAAFRNIHIGFVFQFHHLLPEFTALENVCIPAFIAKTPHKKAEDNARELLAFLGLKERLEHKPSELSGGEQQRVAVARALINNPSIILADEPSGNLDSKNSSELHNLFFSLRDKYNQTFIITTHNEKLADMADRKLTMKDGVIDR
ncbi:MAG: ABC transporter ATP-binding protein [Bacteroidota bacterium]